MSRPLLSPSVSRSRRAFPSVLFDEAHSEAWSIRAVTVAATMNPRHPGDAGYLKAAATPCANAAYGRLAHRGTADPAALAERDVVVVAHPSDGTWERVTGIGSAVLSADEIDALETFVRAAAGWSCWPSASRTSTATTSPSCSAGSASGR